MDPDPPIVQPAASVTVIRLYHGTDVASANDILANGLDAARAAAYNGTGEFWATTVEADADWFAIGNTVGQPARFEFDLPIVVVNALLCQVPVIVIQDTPTAYEFLPPSFDRLNKAMSNKRVVTLP